MCVGLGDVVDEDENKASLDPEITLDPLNHNLVFEWARRSLLVRKVPTLVLAIDRPVQWPLAVEWCRKGGSGLG